MHTRTNIHAQAQTHSQRTHALHTNTQHTHQENLLAELMVNPVPPRPVPETTTDLQGSAVPPHVVDGSELTIRDLMVDDADLLKDQTLEKWLDAREKMGFENMAASEATGMPDVDPATVRTLGSIYMEQKGKLKCRGNAITRSCAFTGSFVILECGRRVLYPKCPGTACMHTYTRIQTYTYALTHTPRTCCTHVTPYSTHT